MAVATFKMQIATEADTALVRDRMIITPHYNDLGAALDHQAILQSVVDSFQATLGGTVKVHAATYQDGRPKPNFPIAQYTTATGAPMQSTAPREVALCCSFYALNNRPRFRGRLYIPLTMLHTKTASAAAGKRPTAQEQADCSAIVTNIAQSMKSNGVHWSVWSETDKIGREVTNWFVDDEWDIQRRRGTVSTSRTTGTAP